MANHVTELTVGVLGLGQGQSHLQAFQAIEGSRVLAVCDKDEALAQAVAHKFNVPKHCTDFAQLPEDKTLDILVIATPDHTHGQFAIQALEAGKHVLSEIPMATTLDEIQRIIALTERTGLKYHMGNQVRYAFCLQDVQKLIGAGDFGDLFYGEGEYLHDMEDIAGSRGADHWRIQSDIPQTTMLGGGPHAIDTLRWLMGARFRSASLSRQSANPLGNRAHHSRALQNRQWRRRKDHRFLWYDAPLLSLLFGLRQRRQL